MRRRTAAVILAALVLTGTAACGSDDTEPKGSSGVDGLTVTGDFGEQPEVEVEDFDVSGTDTSVLIEGDGPVVETGDTALINLHIVNGTTGKKAYSTFDSERAQEVTVDEESLPGGLGEALAGQKRGTRVLMTATVSDAIGPDGAEQIGLGKDDDVVFVADLVSVHPSEALDAPEGEEQKPGPEVPTVLTDGDDVTGFDFSTAPKKPGDDLQVFTLVEGDGPAIPDAPTYVTFNYFGAVYGEKKPFDESFSKEPATFAVGNSQLIKGWDEGLVGVKAGSRVLMVIPADQGYGEQGSPPSIPGNATLVFVIDVLGVDA